MEANLRRARIPADGQACGQRAYWIFLPTPTSRSAPAEPGSPLSNISCAHRRHRPTGLLLLVSRCIRLIENLFPVFGRTGTSRACRAG